MRCLKLIHLSGPAWTYCYRNQGHEGQCSREHDKPEKERSKDEQAREKR